MRARMMTAAMLLFWLAGSAMGEGGETIESAKEIFGLPFADEGNTCDNMNDYDEACPWSGSVAPDVVYELTTPYDLVAAISLCNSAYDTKLYVYAGSPDSLVACNDDGCPEFQSRIESVALEEGITYYVVVDGYGDDCGDYLIEMTETPPCIVACPDGGQAEGEPPCQDGYADTYNSGCFGVGWTSVYGQEDGCADVCGRGCTYVSEGQEFWDYDWFQCHAAGGAVLAGIEAEFPVAFYMVYSTDCEDLQFISTYRDPCYSGNLMRVFETAEEFWLIVHPSVLTGIPESDYLIHVCGIQEPPVPVAPSTWGGIKELFKAK